MPNVITHVVCKGPCGYDSLHACGVDQCSYQAWGVLKPGEAKNLVWDGPSQLIRAAGFARVTRRVLGNGDIEMFWGRSRTHVTLTVVPVSNERRWSAVVTTTGGRREMFTDLRALAARVARVK